MRRHLDPEAVPRPYGRYRQVVSVPAAGRLLPYYDALMAWSLKKGARIRELRALIQRYSETSGALQWQFGGPMRRVSPWALSTTRDLNQGCDVEVIAAYFAPPWSMPKRIARVGTEGRARVITAAAAIMVVVFGSFVVEDIREIKVFGLGLALAVLLDATLVRMVLVPATMALLGDRNWWMPRWLDRVIPSVTVESAAPSPRAMTSSGASPHDRV